jgi:hypothetical protein
LARCAALLVAPSLIAAVAMLPFAGLDFRSAYGSQVSRDFTQDSTPAVVMAELSRAGVGDQRALFSQECRCFVRRGSAVPALRLAFNVLLLAGLALLAYALARGQADGERLVIASAAAHLLLVLTYPVYSPQYMLWLIPALVLLVGDRTGAVALGLFMVATALVAYSDDGARRAVKTLSVWFVAPNQRAGRGSDELVPGLRAGRRLLLSPGQEPWGTRCVRPLRREGRRSVGPFG